MTINKTDFGGQIIIVHGGLGRTYENERPVVVQKGMKLIGVQILNADRGY